MRINVLAVGKVKENYFLDGIKEYSKRITRFSEFNIIEVKEENIFLNPSESEIEIIKNKEALNLEKYLKGYIIILAIEGKIISSEELSLKISEIKNSGCSEITFVIGGSYGVAEQVKKKADYLLSFSKMTFPHTLTRLILTEQIYRSFMISSGSCYHK